MVGAGGLAQGLIAGRIEIESLVPIHSRTERLAFCGWLATSTNQLLDLLLELVDISIVVKKSVIPIQSLDRLTLVSLRRLSRKASGNPAPSEIHPPEQEYPNREQYMAEQMALQNKNTCILAATRHTVQAIRRLKNLILDFKVDRVEINAEGAALRESSRGRAPAPGAIK